MTSTWSRYKFIITLLNQITGAIAALAIVCAALIVTEGIIVRKIFGISTIWQIEASIILLIYATFVGAAHAQINEKHLNVDLVIVYLNPIIREYILIGVSIITCIICAIVTWYAWPMWWEALVRNDHSESLWAPPLWIPYFFIPFGMFLLFLQYIAHIGDRIAALKKLTNSA